MLILNKNEVKKLKNFLTIQLMYLRGEFKHHKSLMENMPPYFSSEDRARTADNYRVLESKIGEYERYLARVQRHSK